MCTWLKHIDTYTTFRQWVQNVIFSSHFYFLTSCAYNKANKIYCHRTNNSPTHAPHHYDSRWWTTTTRRFKKIYHVFSCAVDQCIVLCAKRKRPERHKNIIWFYLMNILNLSKYKKVKKKNKFTVLEHRSLPFASRITTTTSCAWCKISQ